MTALGVRRLLRRTDVNIRELLHGELDSMELVELTSEGAREW